MLSKRRVKGNLDTRNYESDYLELPFENTLREFRKINIHKALNKYPHKKIIEIGCGPSPIFSEFFDFDKMFVVEPGKMFSDMAKDLAKSNPDIIVINEFIENAATALQHESFDFIIIGGFLHETKKPDSVLQSIRKLSSQNTIIYSFVPNAKSFHRLLAYEMGIIGSIYHKSDHDILFQRQNVYDIDGFNELLKRNNFNVIESGSYFIKPFTHDQMKKNLGLGIIDHSVLEGLDRMIKYLPEHGSEIWNISKKNDKIS